MLSPLLGGCVGSEFPQTGRQFVLPRSAQIDYVVVHDTPQEGPEDVQRLVILGLGVAHDRRGQTRDAVLIEDHGRLLHIDAVTRSLFREERSPAYVLYESELHPAHDLTLGEALLFSAERPFDGHLVHEQHFGSRTFAVRGTWEGSELHVMAETVAGTEPATTYTMKWSFTGPEPSLAALDGLRVDLVEGSSSRTMRFAIQTAEIDDPTSIQLPSSSRVNDGTAATVSIEQFVSELSLPRAFPLKDAWAKVMEAHDPETDVEHAPHLYAADFVVEPGPSDEAARITRWRLITETPAGHTEYWVERTSLVGDASHQDRILSAEEVEGRSRYDANRTFVSWDTIATILAQEAAGERANVLRIEYRSWPFGTNAPVSIEPPVTGTLWVLLHDPEAAEDEAAYPQCYFGPSGGRACVTMDEPLTVH